MLDSRWYKIYCQDLRPEFSIRPGCRCSCHTTPPSHQRLEDHLNIRHQPPQPEVEKGVKFQWFFGAQLAGILVDSGYLHSSSNCLKTKICDIHIPYCAFSTLRNLKDCNIFNSIYLHGKLFRSVQHRRA